MYTPLKSHAIFHPDTALSAKQIHHRLTHFSVAASGSALALGIAADIASLRQYSSKAKTHNHRKGSSKGVLPEFPDLEQLDLSKLDNFEAVNDQYHEQGIQFKNAIALHPSNPAFPPRNGKSIVLGGPKSGTIDFIFSSPVHIVEGYVTSSATTSMTAFDYNDRVLSRDETSGRNLADPLSPYPPNPNLQPAPWPGKPIDPAGFGHRVRDADRRFSR